MIIFSEQRQHTFNKLLETDHASAFMVNPAKIFLTSSLITVQNLVVVSHTVCTHVGLPTCDVG